MTGDLPRPSRRCRGSNPGHPRDRREYSPLYYNDMLVLEDIFSVLLSLTMYQNVENIARSRRQYMLCDDVRLHMNWNTHVCTWTISW